MFKFMSVSIFGRASGRQSDSRFRTNIARLLMASSAAVFLPLTGVDARKGVELGAGVPFYNFDNETFETDRGWRALGGYRFDNPWSIEINHNKFGPAPSAGFDYTFANLLYHFNVNGVVEPFVNLGLGEADMAYPNFESSFASNVGAGAKFYLGENFILRPDVNLVIVDKFEADKDIMTSLSLSYLFGNVSSPKPKKVVAPEPEPEAVVGPIDSDGDGVSDDADNCPSTPSGVAVDAVGCPLDSDGDGVYDYQDNCPDTASRLKVDESGCPMVLKEAVSIDLKVQFDTNSDVVKSEYFPEIRKVAEFLEQYQGASVTIEGHTDTRGSAAYNKQLSQRRADSVARTLVNQFGVSSNRVRSIGYGEEQPIADESTRDGLLANRRVVAQVAAEIEKVQER